MMDDDEETEQYGLRTTGIDLIGVSWPGYSVATGMQLIIIRQ